MTQLPQLGPREVVYRDKYQEIYRVNADFGPFTKEYFVRHAGLRAGVLVVKRDSALLVRQYRLLVDDLSWEIPGGRMNDGEAPEAAAIRECWEETGVRCESLKRLLFFHPGLDTTDNPTYLFCTDEFVETEGPGRADGQETVAHLWVPLNSCLEMVFSGQIVDSLSVVALLAYAALTGRP